MRALCNGREVTIKQGKKTLLQEVSFTLHARDKAVIVGRNGTGKTTLLTVLARLNEIDGGELTWASGVEIGYLPQEFSLPPESTIHEVLQREWAKRHAGTWTEAVGIEGLLNTFTLPEFDTRISRLSGGQHRRVALLKALLLEPDLLLLDEPTNHLDLEMIKALEQIVRTYPHACVIISHDRYFVDQVATKIIEIDEKKLHTHQGNFKDYVYSRETRLTNLEKAEEKRQDFLRREKEWVHAGVKARGTKNKGRLKAYYEIKNQPDFKRRIDPALLIPEPPQLGSKVLRLHSVNVEIGGKRILTDFDFKFEAGYKLGLVGSNGSGKTTFLQTLTGRRPPQKGKVVIGDSTIINYQDQNRSELDLTKSILEEVAGGGERLYFKNDPEGRSVNSYAYLKRFLFSSEQIRTAVYNLSGGERARVLLAKLFRTASNFLVLDEPTNDLDIETLNVLEKSLRNYAGCLVIVSHDRYFLNTVCTHILALDGTDHPVLSTGNYDDYVRKYLQIDQNQTTDTKNPPEPETKSPAETKPVTPKLTNQARRQLKKESQRLEAKIEKIEAKIKDKETKFQDPAFFQRQNLKEFVYTLEKDKQQLEQYQDRWLKVAGELEG